MRLSTPAGVFCLSSLLLTGCGTGDPAEARKANTTGVRDFKSNDYRSAELEHRKAVKLEPAEASYHDNLGLDLLYLNRDLEARKEFSDAATLKPSHETYYADLARADLRLGDDAKAEEEARKAVEVAPSDPYSNFYLAYALSQNGKYSEAFGPARLAAITYVDHANCQQIYAMVLWGLGRYKEAQAQLQEACRLKPNDHIYRLYLAEVDALCKDYAATVGDAQSAIILDTKDARAHDLLGVATLHLKRYPEALSAFKSAVSLEPSNPDWHLGLGSAEYRLGDKKKAMSEWSIAAMSKNSKVKSRAEDHLKNPDKPD